VLDRQLEYQSYIPLPAVRNHHERLSTEMIDDMDELLEGTAFGIPAFVAELDFSFQKKQS
jgi:hypothetical protein